jgi:hypothetical protein
VDGILANTVALDGFLIRQIDAAPIRCDQGS